MTKTVCFSRNSNTCNAQFGDWGANGDRSKIRRRKCYICRPNLYGATMMIKGSLLLKITPFSRSFTICYCAIVSVSLYCTTVELLDVKNIVTLKCSLSISLTLRIFARSVPRWNLQTRYWLSPQIVWVYLHSFMQTAVKRLAYMRLPIGFPLNLYAYLLSFPKHNNTLVENLRFIRRFYPPQSRLKPSQAWFPGLWHEIW